MRSQISAIALLSASLSPQVFAAPNPATSFEFQERSSSFELKSFKKADIIEKDVAIIGGGSSGTYSAISLKDKGKSVIVVEKKGRIGGHTETYIDPATDTPVDIGVVMFHNTSVVTDYFKRFDIPLIVLGSDGVSFGEQYDWDYRTGKQVNVSSPTQEESGAAFAKYAEIISQWPKLDDGMFLPDPVPEDLVLPFGEFVKKHGIEAVVQTMFTYNPGFGDILTVPTIEQVRLFGLGLVQQLSTGFLTTAHHNSSELYSKAETELISSNSLLLNSEVIAGRRTDGEDGVQLIVNTPSGKKLIKAKKLLITIPPKLDFLSPFDLSGQEKNIFGKFINAGYYTSIVKDTGIPDNKAVANFAPNTSYNLPQLPGIYHIQPSAVSGLHVAYYGATRTSASAPIPDSDVQSDIIAGIKKLQEGSPDMFEQSDPEFVVFSSHSPFYLQAKPEDTKAGFYNDLYGLQGLRNTYWTGATWRAQDSSDTWRYTEEEVLPKLLEGL
jgi:hypothetical protein